MACAVIVCKSIAVLGLLIFIPLSSQKRKTTAKPVALNKKNTLFRFILCDTGSEAYVHCPMKGDLMTIVAGDYGRTSNSVCKIVNSNYDDVHCTTGGAAKTALEKECNGKSACNVIASMYVLDEGNDPCWGTWKYLNMTFKCSKPNAGPTKKPTPGTKPVALNKQNTLFRLILCDSGKKAAVFCPQVTDQITIIAGDYGRTSNSVCKIVDSNYDDTQCTTGGLAKKALEAACNKRNACTVLASMYVLDQGNDPCWGTWKYLNMTYKCTSPKTTTKKPKNG